LAVVEHGRTGKGKDRKPIARDAPRFRPTRFNPSRSRPLPVSIFSKLLASSPGAGGAGRIETNSFFGSENGGKTAATLYTLVQSARRNCVDVWPYLTDVLRRIAAIEPGDTAALEALLPDRWLAAHPEHRLEQREEESREAQARRRRKRAARRIAATQ
jgi:hypothetical protein